MEQNRKVSRWLSTSQVQTTGSSGLAHMALVSFQVFSYINCKFLWKLEDLPLYPHLGPPSGHVERVPAASAPAVSGTQPFRVLQGPASAVTVQLAPPLYVTCLAPGVTRVWDPCLYTSQSRLLKNRNTHPNASNFLFPWGKKGEKIFFPTTIKHSLVFRLSRNIKCINYSISYFVAIFLYSDFCL